MSVSTTMSRLIGRSASLLMVIAVFALGGCGYAQNEIYSAEHRTVAVPIFENESFYQGLEFDITEAVIKEIELRTPYKVTHSDTADTILRGSITRAGQLSLSQEPKGGMVQDLEMRLAIDFEWKDLRSGRILLDRRGFEAVGRYSPARPISEPVSVAQHDAAARLAQALVTEMQAQW